MQLGLGLGVEGDLEQGHEDVLQQLLEVLDDALMLVDVVQAWHLPPINDQMSSCSAAECSWLTLQQAVNVLQPCCGLLKALPACMRKEMSG